jgi:hypothetical protein
MTQLMVKIFTIEDDFIEEDQIRQFTVESNDLPGILGVKIEETLSRRFNCENSEGWPVYYKSTEKQVGE